MLSKDGMEQPRLHKHQWLEFYLPKETNIFMYNSLLEKFDKLYNIKKTVCKSSEFLGLSLIEKLAIFPLLVVVSIRVADLVPDGNHQLFTLSRSRSLSFSHVHRESGKSPPQRETENSFSLFHTRIDISNIPHQ